MFSSSLARLALMQRVVSEINRDGEFLSTAQYRVLAKRLKAPILKAGRLSDKPLAPVLVEPPICDQLRALGRDAILTFSPENQHISLKVEAEGICPPILHNAIVRTAKEMVGHAIRHGMKLLREGKVEILLSTHGNGITVLTVRDDGWHGLNHAHRGEGLGMIAGLAAPYGGLLKLQRCGGWTEATLIFPSASALRDE